MPLPDLPPNNTARAWLKYTWGGIEHELCFRLPADATQADAIATASDLAVALRPYIGTADAFTGLRYANDGSNLSFPLAWSTTAGTADNPTNDQQRSAFVSLAGRSAGGYRCRVTFFSNYWGTPNDFRSGTTGSNAGGALWAAVQAAEPPLVAIDGLGVVWNGYVNQGYNAYWQRQFR
jgi:hypothetical protein